MTRIDKEGTETWKHSGNIPKVVRTFQADFLALFQWKAKICTVMAFARVTISATPETFIAAMKCIQFKRLTHLK